MPNMKDIGGVSGIARNTLQNYVVDSNEALEFKLVRSAADLENDEVTFKPEMSHQVYGDSESIFGYTGLRVKLYYSAARLATYLSMACDEMVDSQKFEVQPDEVIKPIAEKIPPGYHSNLDTFVAALDKDATFQPFGELKHKFTIDVDGKAKNFEVYMHDISPSGFNEYHERLQTFILWYIDAASYIDTDDNRWRFFLVYEKYLVNGNPQYAIAGYTTVYEYYAYPANTRPRISQMLVLPPFQRMGIGVQLLNTIYNHFTADDRVVDITVEDPSENFLRIRDFVDSKNCLKLPSFKPEKLDAGWSPDMAVEAQKKLKLSKKQTRRVYEILKLHITDRANPNAYKKYRLEVKSRLNVPYRKEDHDMNKLKKMLSPEEFNATTMMITSKEQRLENLENQYNELEEHYCHVLERLASADLS
ncbi:histone acetyltransferase 1 isoform X2 [Oratosquilla oratoria]|uniref:histone acetyltransferase 1 isoform X2 n=1 Tax=Oratosquilla oratoria TaxID=337810 RepID=UPI003F7779BF